MDRPAHKRSPSAPDVPTITEAGVPGYEVESWQAIFAPAKTPPAIIEKMHAGVVKALAEPSLIKKLSLGAYSAEASTPNS